MLLLSIAPLSLCGGAVCGTVALVIVTVALPFSKTLVTPDERVEIRQMIGQLLGRWNAYRLRSIAPQETVHAI
jgi:hypothetical protein